MDRSHRIGLALATVAALALSLSACSGMSSNTGSQPPLQASGVSHGSAANVYPPPEIINQFNSLPDANQPTSFTITLKGNLVQSICGLSNPPCSEQPLYGVYNPFCPPAQGPSNPCYPAVAYDPVNDETLVTYSGPTLYENVPGHTNYYHFGLFATTQGSSWIKGYELTSNWGYPGSTTNPQAIVSINWDGKNPKGARMMYATVFISVALKKGGPVVYGTWNDVPYVPAGSQQPHITFKNYGKQPLFVVSSGIIPNQPVPTDPECQKNLGCDENMAILKTLNFDGNPPPGTDGSKFIPLTRPPSKTLKPTKLDP